MHQMRKFPKYKLLFENMARILSSRDPTTYCSLLCFPGSHRSTQETARMPLACLSRAMGDKTTSKAGKKTKLRQEKEL